MSHRHLGNPRVRGATLFHIKALEDRTSSAARPASTALSVSARAREPERRQRRARASVWRYQRDLSQAVKEIAERPAGQRSIVSICTDGGQGSVA
jgi:hypothetical protein